MMLLRRAPERRGPGNPLKALRPIVLLAGLVVFAFGLGDLASGQSADPDAEPDTLSEAPAEAQAASPTDGPMTLDRMETVLTALDPATERAGTAFRLTIEDVPILIITDPIADRMRALVPIRSADGISGDDLLRMMQANFDSALDARYSVAEGRVWAVFIHPLSPLRTEQLISGIGQTVNAALTYGTLYSSGEMQFGRGDSRGEQRKLLDRLQEKGQDI